MTDRLPPLTSLRAFDAAARHMSFAAAAEELSVTPAALSFQIKSLEEHLGAPVFRRLNRAVELTDLGRALAPGTAQGFANLKAAWSGARRMLDSSGLTVTAGPAITSKWLSPRLFQFAEAHPEIELKFLASMKMVNLEQSEVDIAIRFGRGREPGMHSVYIMNEWVTPMLAPRLAEKVKTPEDLFKLPLMHMEDGLELSRDANWEVWCKHAGLPMPPRGGPSFSHPDHAVNAAVAGAGVIMGRISLSAGDLAEGRLVAPFPLALTTNDRFRMVCAPGAEARPHVRAFIDWVLEQAKSFDPPSEGRDFVQVSEAGP